MWWTPDTQLITSGLDVLPGNAPDSSGAVGHLVAQSETNTGVTVAEVTPADFLPMA